MTQKKQVLYLPPALTVDVVIFTIEEDTLKTLLIKRTEEPFQNKWALPGGFLLKDETTHKAAERILKEKAGVSGVYLEQLYTFDAPNRDPRGRVATVAYFAVVNRKKITLASKGTTQTPTFYAVKSIPRLAFDHDIILDYALQRLRYKIEYTNIVYSLLLQKFTFSQLQQAYEAIWAKKLDKRNFRKKFMALGLIKPTRGKLEGGRHRPARLYQFVSRKPVALKRFF